MARNLKRFENPAQLIRHIHEETGVPKDDLWDRYKKAIEENKDEQTYIND
jgi:hypothetical protein